MIFGLVWNVCDWTVKGLSMLHESDARYIKVKDKYMGDSKQIKVFGVDKL
jgi:hypothetical protein